MSRKIIHLAQFFKRSIVPGMHIGRNIRAIIEELGISQGELSRLTGIPLRTISGWINGEAPNPGFQYLYRIAKELQVTPGFIADYGDTRYSAPQTVRTKRQVAKALLADIAKTRPDGPEARALAILESHEAEPPEVQEACSKVRRIMSSGSDAVTSVLEANISVFLDIVEERERAPKSQKGVMPQKLGS
jgi:transcriptional regulator with XRE-family HTH domain